MAIQNGGRYVKTIIDAETMISRDFGNRFRFVSQKPYRGKPEKGLAAGATVTLQILEDNSEPIIDKTTGVAKDDNTFQTFDATIVGVDYPLAIKKGDFVSLGGFLPDASFYIDFSFILRFREIRKLLPPQTPGGDGKNALLRKGG